MSVNYPTRLRSEKPIEKAARLLREDRVTLLEDATVYRVVGDTGTYDVIAGPDGIRCPCPAHIPLCAHVIATMGMRYGCAVRVLDEPAQTPA